MLSHFSWILVFAFVSFCSIMSVSLVGRQIRGEGDIADTPDSAHRTQHVLNIFANMVDHVALKVVMMWSMAKVVLGAATASIDIMLRKRDNRGEPGHASSVWYGFF
jgi:hypothetical protein